MKLISRVGLIAWLCCPLAASAADRPNIVLIMTDDQGYGDLGVHGNPVIQTPNLDAFAGQSVRVDPFYVSPVCAPTRASLMTGRYNYRTGVVDTYLGRAMMDPGETTIAEILSDAGYRTAIFGKWHLGDNYPLRPIDQGFERALIHKGGGIKQPSDPWFGTDYFDAVLYDDGQEVRTKGYCADVYTDALIEYIGRDEARPFFAYLATNTPHNPAIVADIYSDPYRAQDLSHAAFPEPGQPLGGSPKLEQLAKIYGMITNIDDNVGRVLGKLDEFGLADDTIVIFMTDNGPQSERYKVGLRARKGSVFQGGIRAPFYIRWGTRLKAGRRLDFSAAHIDVLPTLLEAAGVETPAELQIDGRSFWGQLTGDETDWLERTLYFQWHRGDAPELGRAFAAIGPRYKLVQPAGRGPDPSFADAKPFLFDLAEDPFEFHDLAASEPEIAERMWAEYEAWFRDVSSTRGYAPVRMSIGTEHENPTILTRQDWRGEGASWNSGAIGHWEVDVARPGPYDVTLRFEALSKAGEARLVVGGLDREQLVEAGATAMTFETVALPVGPARIEPAITEEGRAVSVWYVEVFARTDGDK